MEARVVTMALVTTRNRGRLRHEKERKDIDALVKGHWSRVRGNDAMVKGNWSGVRGNDAMVKGNWSRIEGQ